MVTFSTGLFICFLNKISASKFKKNKKNNQHFYLHNESDKLLFSDQALCRDVS